MKNFDIEDPITKLNQVSTKRGEALIDNEIFTLKDQQSVHMWVQTD